MKPVQFPKTKMTAEEVAAMTDAQKATLIKLLQKTDLDIRKVSYHVNIASEEVHLFAQFDGRITIHEDGRATVKADVEYAV